MRPAQAFIETEAAGGIVLVVAATAALLWANSPWSEQYFDLLHQRIVVDIGIFSVDEDLHFWVNDIAMVIFFFLVGLEIKRELVMGELASVRRVVVPLAAAAGGMLVPLAIFLLVATDGDARGGWGIPMATDIAFAIGVVALLGPRVPQGMTVLLLAVAIFDDLGAVAIIAVFYTESIAWQPLLLAGGLLLLTAAINRAGVRPVMVYVGLGIAVWAAVFESGLHPTVAGVALGLLTPLNSWYRPDSYPELAGRMLERFRRGLAPDDSVHSREQRLDALLTISDVSRETVAPLDRLEHELHPWVAFVVVPLFAFANAGLELGPDVLREAATSSLTWGVTLALVAGKPLGIVLGAWVAVRLGASLPAGVTWGRIGALGVLAGIGFTVSLFVADLAYADQELATQAKVGILVASALAGVGGYAALRLFTGPADEEPAST